MQASELSQLFLDHSKKILATKSSTSKYRAKAYENVANKIAAAKGTMTEANIDKLGLTDYMTVVVKNITNGNEFNPIPPTKPEKDKKSKSKSRAKPSDKKTKPKREKSLKEINNLINDLTKFMGLGEERARALIKDGLTHVNQLHMKKWLDKLPKDTKMYLEMKPEPSIPHEVIKKIEAKVLPLQSKDTKYVFVGSYRRKKPTSRDIDVMVVSPEEEALETFIGRIRYAFKGHVYPYSKGLDKRGFIITYKGHNYKMDAFRVEPENYVPMLLYSTGSKEHNIKMRATAKRKKMLLNQKGLFVKRAGGNIKVTGLDDEKAYFTILGLDYLEPEKRT